MWHRPDLQNWSQSQATVCVWGGSQPVGSPRSPPTHVTWTWDAGAPPLGTFGVLTGQGATHAGLWCAWSGPVGRGDCHHLPRVTRARGHDF